MFGRWINNPLGMTVRFDHNNKMKLCEVIEKDDSTGLEEKGVKIRVLNSKENHVVPTNMVAPLYEPEPSNILNHLHGTDGTVMAKIMSQSKIEEIWETSDSNFTENERLFHYWHTRLRHSP